MAGVALGGLIGVVGSWLVHRSERAERQDERSRQERKEACVALLTKAEDSLHLFQWLAEGQFTVDGVGADRQKADTFYDQEVTTRYRVLKIIGRPEVVEAAREMRRKLNDVRHLVVDPNEPPSAESREFKDAHNDYRTSRDRFIEIAQADLGQQRSSS